MAEVRVRIAPAPTGFLHVGTARTALYNWLFARNQGGKFLLRIEDTDVARSKEEVVGVIMDSLKWLRLDWDDSPYFQSERLALYRKYADELVDKNLCYPCYCTKEELAERRKRAMEEKVDWTYDRRCYHLSEAEKEARAKSGTPAMRFFVPEGTVSFEDRVHGVLTRESRDIEDFIIVRSDGTPTYNLACVIDDHHMTITHVMRGEEHIANAYKQTLLYKALGWDPPEFIHLPLILGTDRSKLSKRHGAVSVLEYRSQGFLPEAFTNFLALLGWSPGDDREILNRKELIELFSLDRVNKSGAVFDIQKLDWMNGEYINRMDDTALLEAALPLLRRSGLVTDQDVENRKNYLLGVMSILKERAKRLTDFETLACYFFKEDFDYDPSGVEKHLSDEEVGDRLELLKEGLEGLESFSAEEIEGLLRETAAELGLKAAKLIHPTRLGLTGMTAGPGLFELMEVLGRETVIARLTRAVEFVKNRGETSQTRNTHE